MFDDFAGLNAALAYPFARAALPPSFHVAGLRLQAIRRSFRARAGRAACGRWSTRPPQRQRRDKSRRGKRPDSLHTGQDDGGQAGNRHSSHHHHTNRRGRRHSRTNRRGRRSRTDRLGIRSHTNTLDSTRRPDELEQHRRNAPARCPSPQPQPQRACAGVGVAIAAVAKLPASTNAVSCRFMILLPVELLLLLAAQRHRVALVYLNALHLPGFRGRTDVLFGYSWLELTGFVAGRDSPAHQSAGMDWTVRVRWLRRTVLH